MPRGLLSPFKDDFKRFLTHQRIAQLFLPLNYGCVTIFMMHRFSDPESGVKGHDPAVLRANLAYLRSEGYELLSLMEVVARSNGEGPPLKKTVVFTVDDGYHDFHHVAAPIFAEFDCPVTVFLVTGFLDSKLWLWWDQVAYVLAQTRRCSLTLEHERGYWQYQWSSHVEAFQVATELREQLKKFPHTHKLELIERLSNQLEVEIPLLPPPSYQPLRWEEVRVDEKRGTRFGPHTVTHPILSRMDGDRARWEIEESWRRVRVETKYPTPVFCYPNGDPLSFSERETQIVQELGLQAAVTSFGGTFSRRRLAQNARAALYALPRFPYPSDHCDFIQIVSGLERLKDLIRRNRSVGSLGT